ncbi:MAG: cytochrome c biogenesis protein ResB [Nocardioidaceae bacterium]
MAERGKVVGPGGRPPTSQPPALRPIEFARWIWRQLTSMRTALVLLFLLAIAAIPGSLIPQEPVDPSAVVAFKRRHPGITPLFDRIGMFHVYSSVWFSAIYLLLFISLLGCIIPRLRVYLRGVRARPPKAPRNLSRLSAYDTWESTADRAAESERARRLLAGQRRRVEVYEGDGEIVVSAEKGYLREAGNLLFHVAVLVVLVGFAVTGLFGFKGTAAVITGTGFSNTLIQYDDFTPGARFNTNNLAPFTLKVQRFNVRYKKSGAGEGIPLNFDAHLRVTSHPGATPYTYDLQVNHPLQIDGTSVFLVGHGYAPRVTVRDGHGHIAFSGPVVFLPQDSSFTSFGVIKAPDAQPTQLGFQGYFFPTGAITPQGQPYSAFPGADNPVLSLIPYSGNLGLDSGAPQSVYVLNRDHMKMLRTASGRPFGLIMRPGNTVKLGKGLGSIRFDGYTTWVQLQINKQPGKVIPLFGVLAAILGLLGSLFIRPRRTWVRLRDRDGRTVVEIAALDRVSGGDPAAHVAAVSAALRPVAGPAEEPTLVGTDGAEEQQ